ncbi:MULTISPECIES: BON domain-containing protein [Providencia]|uniref:Osmotically-inducible protein Y n=1 Tax=Providencia heimbachae ATCC 35613 TaxID=1354272 RepID=A0A1B7K529_9GAMM|nr:MULTISPECIES: BON domain-containing protein [Providencia]MBP6122226.1 BON domain-containing protein [Providencia sp.]MDD9341506.1 BON domain-containing protein [Providencia heimbachae]NIH22486.1 BON domain-containing protein [Providencia heimbachae]OAT55258.1 putative lipoprotein [Providencia heimbachae ATCC 35613]QCJ69862.1 BON domain-containing protein [Providencia heimbachae]
MNMIKSMNALFIAAFMALTLSACAPTAKTEGTGGYIDDTVITTKVKSALLAEKDLKSTQISVETFKGRVQLSGFVASNSDANKAIEAARQVKGVQSVINSMKIR